MATSLASLSADELIARGIAPVSKQYWKPVEARQEVAAVGSSQIPGAGKGTDKKSRRQARKVCNDMLVTSLLSKLQLGHSLRKPTSVYC